MLVRQSSAIGSIIYRALENWFGSVQNKSVALEANIGDSVRKRDLEH